jgi:hypothetical protein
MGEQHCEVIGKERFEFLEFLGVDKLERVLQEIWQRIGFGQCDRV